jgi:hypothetical protein
MDSEIKYVVRFRPVYYYSPSLHDLQQTKNYHCKYSVSLFDPRYPMRLLPLESCEHLLKSLLLW